MAPLPAPTLCILFTLLPLPRPPLLPPPLGLELAFLFLRTAPLPLPLYTPLPLPLPLCALRPRRLPGISVTNRLISVFKRDKKCLVQVTICEFPRI